MTSVSKEEEKVATYQPK